MAQVLPVGVVRPSPIELVRVRDAFAGTRGLRNSAHFHRVRTGVYAARPAWDTLRPWERYLARVHAYALVNSDAVFAYESAAAMLGLPVFGEPALIHVYALARTRSRRFGDVFVHSCVAVPETVTLGAHTMTTPATTTADLMRVLPPPFGLAVGDAGCRGCKEGCSPSPTSRRPPRPFRTRAGARCETFCCPWSMRVLSRRVRASAAR